MSLFQLALDFCPLPSAESCLAFGWISSPCSPARATEDSAEMSSELRFRWRLGPEGNFQVTLVAQMKIAYRKIALGNPQRLKRTRETKSMRSVVLDL